MCTCTTTARIQPRLDHTLRAMPTRSDDPAPAATGPHLNGRRGWPGLGQFRAASPAPLAARPTHLIPLSVSRPATLANESRAGGIEEGGRRCRRSPALPARTAAALKRGVRSSTLFNPRAFRQPASHHPAARACWPSETDRACSRQCTSPRCVIAAAPSIRRLG